MELELKYYAAYLPYDIKVYNIGTKKIEKIYELKKYVNPKNEELFYIVTNSGHYSSLYQQLILRPLSDLTNEIEIGGKKFIPIDELNKIHPDYKIFIEDDECYIKDLCNMNMTHICTNLEFYDKLLSWHFDLFGLIENNLAIDINTI